MYAQVGAVGREQSQSLTNKLDAIQRFKEEKAADEQTQENKTDWASMLAWSGVAAIGVVILGGALKEK